MRAEERTRAVYERIEGYPVPPLPPLPHPRDFSGLQDLGVVTGGLTDTLVSAALRLSGYRPFERDLPRNIEGLLSKHNLRLSAVHAPITSATLALADDARPLSATERAATLIVAACGLRDDIFSGRLPASTLRGEPLEMGQYPNVFSTNLVVGESGLTVFKSSATDQLQVMIGGRLYVLTLPSAPGSLRIEDCIQALSTLVERARERPLTEDEFPVGLLTAAVEPIQRRAFGALATTPAGAAAVERTKHALMTVCFDLDSAPTDAAEAALMAHSRHGENRWFHSSLQLVVFGNGKAAAICNFATYLDGNTMMRVGSELQKRAASCAMPASTATASALPEAEEVAFPMLPGLAPVARAARRNWDAVQDRQNQQATYTLEDLGRRALSAPGVEPVPAFICALAMTTRQLTGRHAHVTQFFAMSRYRCSDLVRGAVTTPEVQRFVDALIAGVGSREEQRELLVRAVASQKEAARAWRRSVPFQVLLMLYLREQEGFRKRFVLALLGGTAWLLNALGRMGPPERDMLVSHPEIYPEVPVVGRPGIRLPDVTCFGMHYQIGEEATVVTMMPGMRWKTPNAEFVERLTSNLRAVQELL